MRPHEDNEKYKIHFFFNKESGFTEIQTLKNAVNRLIAGEPAVKFDYKQLSMKLFKLPVE